jgi:hypothetical protein
MDKHKLSVIFNAEVDVEKTLPERKLETEPEATRLCHSSSGS